MSSKHDGPGMGTASVQEIVRELGGFIQFSTDDALLRQGAAAEGGRKRLTMLISEHHFQAEKDQPPSSSVQSASSGSLVLMCPILPWWDQKRGIPTASGGDEFVAFAMDEAPESIQKKLGMLDAHLRDREYHISIGVARESAPVETDGEVIATSEVYRKEVAS